MDIVSRLKQFIDSHSIPVTQFADNCMIPRPSLSQLLNGRNKKVSDEVISKIHAAYPNLSMLWLMFGEGSMETSVHEESVMKSEPELPLPDSDDLLRFDVTYIADSPESMAKRREIGMPPAIPTQTASSPASQSDKSGSSKISFTTPTAVGKRVVSIVVYYDDKSYESFIPDPSGRSPFA